MDRTTPCNTLSFSAFATALVLVGCGPAPAAPDASRIAMIDAPLGCRTPGGSGAGDPCRCVSDCVEGSLCVREDESSDVSIPGGACSRPCTSDDGCAEGDVCAGTSARTCARRCTSTSDCATGRVCADGHCQPHCTADTDCDSGNCNEASGYCLAPGASPRGTARLFEPCLRDEDCVSDLCSERMGICIGACSVSRQSCPDGAVCVGTSADPANDWSQCAPGCVVDTDCPESSECLERPFPAGARACTFPTACPHGDASVLDGGACDCDSDCATGSCYREVDTGAPSGLCYHACTSDADCSTGTTCNGEYCATPCVSPADCRAGWVCDGESCQPLCQADSDCPTYERCDLYTGTCGLVTSGAGVGATCTSDDACRSGYCNDGGWPEGYCISNCSVAQQACPEGAYCRPRSGAGDFGFCAPTCETGADCAQASADCVGSPPATPLHCY